MTLYNRTTSENSSSNGGSASANAAVAAATAVVAASNAAGAVSGGTALGQRVDMSGVWKRVKLENYENFIAAQGATFLQRKLASSIQMIHTITMSEDCAVVRLQVDHFNSIFHFR